MQIIDQDLRNIAKKLRDTIDEIDSQGNCLDPRKVSEARVICDEVGDKLACLSWAEGIPAPVDADGEVVPLTTKVMYDDDGEELVIHSFTLVKEHDGYWWNVSYTLTKCQFDCAHPLNLVYLRRPDSWERLEEDVKQFENEVCACSYYGKKRLDCDGCKSPCQPGANCRESVVGDVLRRAKALAERDAKGASRG